jgi:hypothetical protein
MNDVAESEQEAQERQRQLTDLFLQRSLAEVERMRRSVSNLVTGDASSWEELRYCARHMAGSAEGLRLGTLAAHARTLAELGDRKFAGVALDAHFLLSVTSAIEVVAIELHQLGYRLR